MRVWASLGVLVGLLALQGCHGKSIADYFLSDDLDGDLQLTATIALKEMGVLRQQGFSEGTMVLPTNTAWARSQETCKWFKALVADDNSELRQELILEVGTAIPGEWDRFYEMLLDYPFIDAASGNVYFVDVETDKDHPQLCLAAWVDGDYQQLDDCTEMELPPIHHELLGRQWIYKLKDVVLPDVLREKLDDAAAGFTCAPNELYSNLRALSEETATPHSHDFMSEMGDDF